MNLVNIAGQVSRDADQSTSELLNKNKQFAEGQAELQKIKLDQQDEKRERRSMRAELEAIQYGQEKAREVEALKSELRKLKHSNEVLRDIAADVILDRSSIRKTIEELKSKWAEPSRFDEFDKDYVRMRAEEKQKIEGDADQQNKAYNLVDDVLSGWSHPSSTRRRRPPASKL